MNTHLVCENFVNIFAYFRIKEGFSNFANFLFYFLFVIHIYHLKIFGKPLGSAIIICKKCANFIKFKCKIKLFSKTVQKLFWVKETPAWIRLTEVRGVCNIFYFDIKGYCLIFDIKTNICRITHQPHTYIQPRNNLRQHLHTGTRMI